MVFNFLKKLETYLRGKRLAKEETKESKKRDKDLTNRFKYEHPIETKQTEKDVSAI